MLTHPRCGDWCFPFSDARNLPADKWVVAEMETDHESAPQGLDLEKRSTKSSRKSVSFHTKST